MVPPAPPLPQVPSCPECLQSVWDSLQLTDQQDSFDGFAYLILFLTVFEYHI